MVTKPSGCDGCALQLSGEGFLTPQRGTNGVVLVGGQLDSSEVGTGRPYSGGRGGFMLTRLLGWAGIDRNECGLLTTTWCAPPADAPNLDLSRHHCRRAHWDALLHEARVVVPMGEEAYRILSGRGGVLSTRGYIRPGPHTSHMIPTVSPEFIVAGQSKYSSAFINDVRKAVELSRVGLPMQLTNYVLDPLPMTAYAWAQTYRQRLIHDPLLKLAYDIETPNAGSDESEREDDASYHIFRISFAYEHFGALSIPWSPPYMPAIQLLLGSEGIKVDWNGAFDRPRVRANNVSLNGPLYDAMIAWHVLHSDLPKGLGFAATFTCPWQPEWKHLSSQRPAFYNATDSDVTLRSMDAIEGELRTIDGLWRVYQRDVIELDPVLRAMETAGMPVNNDTRIDRALKLAERTVATQALLEAMIPLEARTYSPKEGFVRAPTDTAGCVELVQMLPVKRCSVCGALNPLKPHFRTLKKPTAKKPQNPCAGGVVVEALEEVTRWARLDPWKPSREALIRYQHVLGRIIPHKWDKKEKRKKPSMDRKALKICMRKYPDDPLYAKVLELRELSKIAGTYIGYVEER